ncbi:hypothetical protein NC653_011682 [Populus alba x Populus x berolinensis]|uniref:Uncharacterized protein n=1 Tax=Populus alba x Populus x berolinensis TaxID=444605 RepID=A0AAD6W789_9ROSI|nr:hypothetical protein NC653_011682 [Populus alba x Populus x berolinensis]
MQQVVTVADIMVLLMGEKEGIEGRHILIPEEMRGLVLPDGQDTTVMIRNIPNRYTYLVLRIALSLSPLVSMTVEGFFSSSSLLGLIKNREMLTEFLDSHCMMENEKAKLQNSDSTKETIVSAFDFLYLPAWDVFQSNKIREIACARIQEQLVKRFEKSTFECDSDEYLPVSYSPGRDGSGQWWNKGQ